MNICRITSAFPPPWNGLSPGPYGLSLAQRGRGMDITVIAREAAGAEEVDSKAPFAVERVPARFDLQFSFRASGRFKALNGRRPFDIVHGHGFSAFGALISKKIGAMSVPVVTTFHCVRRTQRRIMEETMRAREKGTGIKPVSPSRFHLAREAFQERLVARGSNGLIAVSEKIKSDLVDVYGISPEMVHVTGNGVDTAIFSPAENRLPNKRGMLNLLWVGKFTGYKGETDLISACRMLRDKGVGFRLKMVGDGGECEKARRYIKELNLNGQIEIITYIPNFSMAEVYRQADVFVFPSACEGMPKAVLEAMACGCPVVATDIPGCRELVMDGRNGFLVPVGSPERIRDALERFYGSGTLLQDMGSISRSIIEKEYTWESVARKIESFYAAVIKDAAKPGSRRAGLR